MSKSVAKKRKTRREKIILQLKRELARQRAKVVSPGTKTQPRQEAILFPAKTQPPKPAKRKNAYLSALSSDSKLIRRDLIKTLILTLLILSLEFVLYLKLR